MNKFNTYISMLCMMVLLTACAGFSDTQPVLSNKTIQQDHSNENIQPEEMISSSEETASSEKTGFLTGDQFKQPSDFVIKDFTLTYNNKQRTVVYHLEYKLGADATAFIVDHQQPYYFQLEVPEKWRDSFAAAKSAEIEGSKLDGNSENIYSLELEVPLTSNITNSTIQQITADPYDYVLYLYENPNFPARVVGNIYGWMRSS